MDKKHFLESKTIWFNMALAAFVVLSDNIELLRDYMGGGGYISVMMLVAAINAYLRSITTQGITK